MPTVTLKVDEATRQRWADAANRAQITLSEWIRQAAQQQLYHEDQLNLPLFEDPALEVKTRWPDE